MTDEKTSGTIFNIQKFSVHDGEGIRTLVFFQRVFPPLPLVQQS